MNLIFMKEPGPNLIEKILFQTVEWEDLLKIDELNANKSTKKFFDKINMLLDTYALFKRVKKYKLEFKSKPWITLGLYTKINICEKQITYKFH